MPDGAPAPAATRIEAVLAARGLLGGAALDRVRRLEAESGERIDHIAAKLGLVSERDLAHAYAAVIGSPVLTAA
ncbi:MAG: type II secretion system protein GspE, partial [Acetobacteraceae bacterium]